MRSSALTNRGVRCKSRSVPAFDCLGDPVRRRILGPCIQGDGAAGEVGAVAQEEFEISRSRVPRELLEVHAGTEDAVLASGLMGLLDRRISQTTLSRATVWCYRTGRRVWS
ncbi:MAG: putative transcriptional regulator, ArsR family [Pseudonocardiales bacterium]|nr:putative transcriptional regulator, ArsR family [Pseudonocardiales bacterium]